MNKTILFTIIVFISLAFLSNFASAKSKIAVSDTCKCNARAVVKCGFSKCDEAKKCRAVYAKKCQTRCNLVLKCSDKIASECISFKKGTLEYKKCERATTSKFCVSQLKKEEMYNCKCKTFAKAVCGTCPSPSSVNCRDDAYEACKKQCGTKLPCKSKKRICITQKGCNCKAVAKTRCAVAKDFGTCFKTQYDTCNKKCLAASRCYPVSCKNAGQKRCIRAVAVVCEKFSADLQQYEQCVQKKTDRCLSFEQATCKKARRLYKYRTECDYSAKVKCETLSADKKCECVKQIRDRCVKEKVEQRKKYIRHCGTCRKRAKLLCDAKENCKDLRACYIEETKHCVRRQKRREHIVPPECVDRVTEFCGSNQGDCYKKNLAECTEKWLCRYCERKGFKVCDGDLECMKQEIRKCKHRLPKCWNNRELCNDNNKCTNDVCDPDVGCIHTTKTCNDNNLCTKDVCDPEKGCVHTETKCDDGIACTRDSCNPQNGQCEHFFNHAKCKTAEKCTVGVCTKNGCEFKKDTTGKCREVVDICKDCKAKNKCEEVSCEFSESLTPICKVTPKNCDDGIECTKDSCDVETGKCVHTKIQSKECDKPLCKDVLDCAAYAKENELSKKCLIAECDAKKGVCVEKPVSNADCVKVEDCVKHCQPRDACEGPTTSCTKDKAGQIICNRPAYPCDDLSDCTKDSCNVNTGVCTHEFIRDNKECIEECETDSHCIEWAVRNSLDKQCKTAVCNKPRKSCKIVEQLDKSKCTTTVCVGCHKRSPCEYDVKCILDKNNKPACVRKTKKCDDSDPCTVDTCDVETGKCVHKFVQSKLCTKCKVDCAAWGKSLKLDQACKKAVCDEKTGHCKVLDDERSKCTRIEPECIKCTPSNACETAVCLFDKDNKPYCHRTQKSCDDKNECTKDTCDSKSGKCVHQEVCKTCDFDSQCYDWAASQKLADECKEAYCSRSGKCRARKSIDQSRCKKEEPKCIDCVPLNKCDSVTCVIEKDVAKCVHTQIPCNDGNDCTLDYCDVNLGECVHQQLNTDECKYCKVDKDCDQFAKDKKLADSCQEAYCENDQCKTRVTDDISKCLKIPLCYQCDASLCEEKTECVFGSDNKPVCKRTPKVCDDGNKCTIDRCDAKTGDCVHTFVKTSQCEPCEKDTDCVKYALDKNLASTCEVAVCAKQGYCETKKNTDTSKCPTKVTCKDVKDCDKWAVDQKLASNCREAVCEEKTKTCISRPMTDLSKCQECTLKCVAKNFCEIATCVNGEAGFFCERSQKSCDDKKDCTRDSCDEKTGKCVHTVVESEKCTICKFDKDCANAAKQLNPNNCEEIFCNAEINLCEKRPIKDKNCVPNEFCQLSCPPKDKCFESKCHYDANNKVVCDQQVLKTCDDKDICTDDSCDPKVGCVHKSNKKCTKCLIDAECAKFAIENELEANCKVAFCNAKGNCETKDKPDPKCVPAKICKESCETPNKCKAYGCVYDENKKVQCTYVIKTCNDNKKCTQDSCDETTGICVHERLEGCGPICKNTLNCIQWGAEKKLSETCQEPLCDQDLGACVAVKSADVTKCPVKDCDKVCVPENKCQKMKCAYDKNQKVICIPEKIEGCTPCTKDSECAALAKQAGKCEKVFCDAKENKCVKESIKSPECSNICPPTCQASSLCEVAEYVKTETSCECKITPISCDDKKSCTVDVCDAKTGKCRNTFQTSDKCTTPCEVDAQCVKYAIDNKLSDKCQLAYCDVKSGSCAVKEDDKTNCKKCQLDCRPSSNCESASCVWDGAKYTCQRESKTCDDGKKCTEDKCDPQSGKCVYTYKCETSLCTTDLDCAAWGQANQLQSKCLKPVCKTADATCTSVPDERCNPTCPSKLSSECPPTKFGSVCDTTTDTCKPNECFYDVDCVGKIITPGTWSYCKPNPYTGQKVCTPPVPGCVENKDCDDKDPCTKDICLKEYGFCRNVKKCDDKNECTFDVATPNAKEDTCTCSHVPVSCTTDSSLLPKAFVSLTNDEKAKWLGKCDKNRGCISCVVNAQCDDHNGCSTDSCENQVCVNKYVTYNGGEFNPWCDPKLASQPIYFQSIPGLRDQLALAGYDINKLAN